MTHLDDIPIPRTTIRRDLILVLAAKAMALGLLWWLFFSGSDDAAAAAALACHLGNCDAAAVRP